MHQFAPTLRLIITDARECVPLLSQFVSSQVGGYGGESMFATLLHNGPLQQGAIFFIDIACYLYLP